MTNRQEIAARLRETGEWFKNHQADIRYMACHIKQIISPNSTLEYQDVFSRLADLIDPTCKDVSEPPKDGFTPVPFFKCSECGCQHISPEYVRYCPGCGARVVRDAT